MSIETMMITSGFYGYPIFGQSHMIKIGSRAAGSPRFVIVWRGHRTTKLIATYCYYLMGVSNASSKSFHVYFRTEQTIISGCGASGCILPALPFCLLLIFLKRNQSSYCFILVTYDNIHIIYIHTYVVYEFSPPLVSTYFHFFYHVHTIFLVIPYFPNISLFISLLFPHYVLIISILFPNYFPISSLVFPNDVPISPLFIYIYIYVPMVSILFPYYFSRISP